MLYKMFPLKLPDGQLVNMKIFLLHLLTTLIKILFVSNLIVVLYT